MDNPTQYSTLSLNACRPWEGSEGAYQTEAYEELTLVGNQPSHWAWISSICDTHNCLNPAHIVAHEAIQLAYPIGVCIYCGCKAETKDHILPRGYTGETHRRFTAIVPCCRWCNSALGAIMTWSITERREIVHEKIRRKNKKYMKTKDFTKRELAEFGPGMRAEIDRALRRKEQVIEMLEWPGSDDFDLRALELSGIPDGFAVGLVEHKTSDFQRRVLAKARRGRDAYLTKAEREARTKQIKEAR